jgi:hypothetical protein
LKVIEIPPLWLLDFELKLDLGFYTRFLALYVSKIKRDWVKKEEKFSGKNPKRYIGDCWTKRLLKIGADFVRARTKYKNYPELFEPGFEERTKKVVRKFEKGKRKKRKKKEFKLWNNCIRLSDYKGVMNINYEYMLKRREYRYKYECLNYAVFGYEKIKKENNTIYKSIITSKMNEPRERKLEILDRECEAQTIDR